MEANLIAAYKSLKLVHDDPQAGPAIKDPVKKVMDQLRTFLYALANKRAQAQVDSALE